jgi:hypothetical protein
MEKRIAPSERKAQELQALVQGQLDAQSGEELLSSLEAIRELSTALGCLFSVLKFRVGYGAEAMEH